MSIYFWRVRTRLPERFGQHCKVLARGRMNTGNRAVVGGGCNSHYAEMVMGTPFMRRVPVES